MESKGIRGGGSQQVDPAGPASLSPKSLALSRQIDSHANMAICHARAQSPMPSFLPQTTTPKLAAYIYTPARVPAGPRCPAAHGLAHRSGVPFFFFCLGAASLQWLDHARGGASKPCWRSRARARRHVGGALALGPPPLVWLHCMLGRRSTCAPSPTWLLAPIIASSPAGRAQWEGSSATAAVEGCWPGRLVRNKTRKLLASG